MITNEDYNFVTAYESVKKTDEKNFLLEKSKLIVIVYKKQN